MKHLLVSVIICVVIGTSFSQELNDPATAQTSEAEKDKIILAYLNLGGSVGVIGNSQMLMDLNAGCNFIINDFYVGAYYNIGFGGSAKQTNNPISYSGYDLRLGFNNKVNGKVRITPYVGMGIQALTKTTYLYDEELNSSLEASSALAGLAGADVTFEPRFLTENIKQFYFPMGMDVNFGGKFAGLYTGLYINASKYQELGFRLGLSVGKRK